MGNLYRNDIADVDISKPIMRTDTGVLLASDDNLANRFGANILLNGQPIDIGTGTVKGYFIRPNGDTVFIDGVANGNTVHVDLPHECYAVNGSFSLAIKVTVEGTTMTARVIDGYIRQTRTDAVVDPGEVLPSLEEVLAKVTEMEQATSDANTAADKANYAAEVYGNRAPAIIEEASGDVVTIDDAAAHRPVALVSHINAAEDGTGKSAVSLTRTGKNLFGGMALAQSIVSQAAGATLDENAKTITYNAGKVVGITLFEYPFKPETQYTLYFTPAENSANSPNMQVFYVGETEGVRLAPITNQTVWAYKTAQGKTVERIAGRNYNGTTILLYEQCGIFEGVVTEEEFVPYEGQTLTAELPEPVTDGVLDWTTGVLTVNEDGTTRTVQLAAQHLEMLKGQNNIWCDTGETTLAYVADTKMYIDNKFAELTAAVLSTGANV